jgi:hypothetical protein
VSSDGLFTGWQRHIVGSEEHYAGYEKEFHDAGGRGYTVRDDAQASYEIDYSYELAFDAYADSGGYGAAEEAYQQQLEEEGMPLLHQAEQAAISYSLGLGPDPYYPMPELDPEIEPF